MKRLCLFCADSTATRTREHVWPLWMGKAMPFGVPYAEASASTDARTGEVYDTREFAHSAKQMNSTVKVPCKRCNSGWMSDLEQAVAPGFTRMWGNEDHLLTEQGQTDLALWAVKTAFMIQAQRPATRAATSDQHQAIYNTRKPPFGTDVFLARWTGRPAFRGGHSRALVGSGRLYMPPASGQNANRATTSMLLHNVVLRVRQYLRDDVRGGGARQFTSEHLAAATQNETDRELLQGRLRLWPPYRSEVNWLTDADPHDDAELLRSWTGGLNCGPGYWDEPVS